MSYFTKFLIKFGIVFLIFALFATFWLDITSMYEVESYSIGMEITEKYIDRSSDTPVFHLEGSGDDVRMQVHKSDYEHFETGDIVEVKVIKLESHIFKVKATIHTVLGAVIED